MKLRYVPHKNSMQEQGMVLIVTLIMLALLALLIISQLQAAFLVYQALNQLQEKHQAFYQLEAAAHAIVAHTWQQQATCLFPEQAPQDLGLLLKHHRGCEAWHEQQRYLYWIEELGPFPCLQSMANHLTYSTQHWRISVLSTGETPNLLQLRIAKLNKLLPCENQAPRLIPVGIISWRYVSNIMV